MRKVIFSTALLFAGLLAFPSLAPARQPAPPKNVVRLANGKFVPAAGYDWMTSAASDLRVRWVPGKKHPASPNVFAGATPDTWRPAPGFKWANAVAGDLRVVEGRASDEAIGKAVLKAIGALVLHDKSKPQPRDDFAEALARGLAREARNKLIESALQDLAPTSTAVERAAVRNLAVLALDGRLDRDRNRVVAELRRTNPGMADAVEIAEFLIRLSQAAERARR